MILKAVTIWNGEVVIFTTLPSFFHKRGSLTLILYGSYELRFAATEEIHCSDIIMSAMASHITSLTIVYSTVYSGPGKKKNQSYASLPFPGNSPVIGEFPAQRASNTENVSIWWRHHIEWHDNQFIVSPNGKVQYTFVREYNFEIRRKCFGGFGGILALCER